ncbi:nuclear transport factor 2 family protein [Leptospira sp. 2 VSF19]|uniref:Nuclear transport factor 2 family protein n=2 Tax=Leptospira soteropolitanensis TaxID=2950025 RepID=A0AAW5VPS1_9LEPT|nr:nuclear transport factor 2 family protein [Leptospira soteropolitanensis]MCW7500923.1 nuclear transport factor 2 family protein [Leptospira soteropolitanensis]MCW7523397.1 nuclear transport factor 2 family protein [Leptospira soteropolitanensis]MCW7527258.1 nuclear transport factor 2 family protein [Leptospira soteropolitanensis]MCW7531115.1 nuclear transport factor 2 family protein [Leptospira soteropolitanensis]
MITNEVVVGKDEESLRKEFLFIMKNIDGRNVSEIESKFHSDYSDSVYIKGNDQVFSSNKANYIQSLKEGKIGGVERAVLIHSIDFIDQFGFVKVDLESHVMKFRSMYILYFEGGEWKLIKAVVVAEKK